jgi:uncharacterized protein (DUF488 family)
MPQQLKYLPKATDLLSRMMQSVEHLSGDTTEYAYTPADRLESKVRTGQVAYSWYYKYNLDGGRHVVERADALHSERVDEYVLILYRDD